MDRAHNIAALFLMQDPEVDTAVKIGVEVADKLVPISAPERFAVLPTRRFMVVFISDKILVIKIRDCCNRVSCNYLWVVLKVDECKATEGHSVGFLW